MVDALASDRAAQDGATTRSPAAKSGSPELHASLFCKLPIDCRNPRLLVNMPDAQVTEGVNVGVGDGKIDVEKALSNALAGMDDALLKVVEANKVALQKLTEGGASFEESSVKKGLKELEAFEEKFLDGVKQAAQEASDRTKEQWKSILDNIPRGGTDTGAHVKETLSAHAREAQAAMRSSREAGLQVMHTLTQNYATLVSGVRSACRRPLNTESPRPSIETAAGVSPADLPRRYIWNRVKAPQHVHGLACRVTTATTRI
jgi:hypothetical protein